MSGANEFDYFLGIISDGPGFEMNHELSSTEFAEIEAALTAIQNTKTPFHYKLVHRNYHDLESLHQFVRTVLGLNKTFARADPRDLVDSLMASVVNWLTSMRLFLDHEETALKRTYGKDSEQVSRFLGAGSQAYDANVGYRFAYRFRNFVQHCGLPVSRVVHEEVPDNDSATPGERIRFILLRDELLESYSRWGGVEADLRAMPAEFELLPLIGGAMEGLRDVYRIRLDIALDAAIADSKALGAALDQLETMDPSSGMPALFRVLRLVGGSMELTPRIIPVDTVRALQAIDAGDLDRESILVEPAAKDDLSFEPSVVKELLEQNSRGVEVIASRLSSSIDRQQFSNLLRSISQADGSIVPLVLSVAEVAALLAQMTAAAIGASAEGLLGGLVGDYRDSDVVNED